MIELKNISKVYKASVNTYALNNINLKFKNNGFSFILGPSGSGKSTLLNIIGGLDKYTSGDVLIDGKSISLFTSVQLDRYRNENVGFIFQSYNMISHLTIYENICLPLRINKISPKEVKNKADELIKKLNLENEKNKYPNQVSGGQAQRAAIARSLINDPKVILADEPTGALDSKNTTIVMDYLKEISKDHLIIMVTHNEALALKYGTNIISLLDGKVEKNEEISEEKEKKDNKKSIRFKFISILASLKLSIRNLFSKKIRALFTILGTSIGIVSTCLVLMVSNSMTNYTEYAQKKALSSYPITITSNVTSDEVENDPKVYPEYPSDNIINVTNNYTSYYSHINVFSNEYLDYLKELDNSLYSVIDYGSSLYMHILSNTVSGYAYLSSSSYLKQMNENTEYVKDEYELLYGESYPNSMYELALVIDKNNCIDAYVLDYLGIDYKDIEEYTFEDICKKEFKIVLNDYYYKLNESTGAYGVNYDLASLYENSEITLKITSILRVKDSAVAKLYNTGILYTSALSDEMHKKACESNIVKLQVEYGLEKNVFSNSPYTDSISDFTTITKEYKLESNLKTLGYYYSISYIKIYTDKFENRSNINSYLEAYNIDKELSDQIVYRDYMGTITEEFSDFINILTKVLIIFSAISLLVSGIMIALLMYVNVVERTKEIGILRCLGYSKPNISIMFLSEASIMGFTSGIIGLSVAIIAIKPILKFVSQVVEDTYSSTYDISTITKVQLNFIQVFLLIIGSMLIAIVSSLVPAIIAAHKQPVQAISHQGE